MITLASDAPVRMPVGRFSPLPVSSQSSVTFAVRAKATRASSPGLEPTSYAFNVLMAMLLAFDKA